jgi:hypothetical protein
MNGVRREPHPTGFEFRRPWREAGGDLAASKGRLCMQGGPALAFDRTNSWLAPGRLIMPSREVKKGRFVRFLKNRPRYSALSGASGKNVELSRFAESLRRD